MMPTRRILATALALPLALALSLPLSLSLSRAAADTPVQDTIIVTATRQAESAALFSGSIGVVDRESLEQVAHVHINEALARVPGTWISRGNGQEHLTAVRSPVYTGPGSCGAFYMAEDGVPIRPAGFCNVNQLFEIHTEQAQRIEVLRGPGGALHGANALHGVINAISQPPAERRETRLALEAGPNDYYRVNASHSDRHGAHGLRLGFTGTSDGGYKDNAGYDQQKLSLRHDWQGDGIRIENLLSYANLNQETAGYIIGRDSYKDSRRKRENPFPEAFRDNRASRAHSRISIDTASGGQWVVTPYLRYQRMRFLQHFLPGQPLEENGLRSAGWQLAHYWPTHNGLTLIAGSDGEFTRAYLKETQPAPAGPAFPQGKHYDYEVDAVGLAAFIRADYELSEATRLNAGLRIEHQRYDYDNRMIDGNTREDGSPCPTPSGTCRYARPGDRKDDFTDYSIHVGAVHSLGGGHSLSANLARGFRAPQAAELYRLQENQLVSDLDSEEMDSLELGWRYRGDTLETQLVAFVMRKDQVIFQDVERRNLNDGRTRHRGVEGELRWTFHPRWQLNAQASYAHHRYANNAEGGTRLIRGNDHIAAPRWTGATQLRWQPVDETWLELEWVHVGRYYLDLANQHDYEGHDLLNLRFSQQLTPMFGWGLRITNLLDTDYAERADHAFNNYRYFVGEPRALYGDIRLRF